jgi:hypothetical protein
LISSGSKVFCSSSDHELLDVTYVVAAIQYNQEGRSFGLWVPSANENTGVVNYSTCRITAGYARGIRTPPVQSQKKSPADRVQIKLNERMSSHISLIKLVVDDCEW